MEAESEDFLRDPLVIFEKWLVNEGISLETLQQLKEKAREEVEAAAALAETIPFPESGSSRHHVFADFSPPQPLSHAEADVDSEKIVMMDALNHALDEEMSSDSHVVVFGQDVAHGKGVSLASPAV